MFGNEPQFFAGFVVPGKKTSKLVGADFTIHQVA